MYLLSDIGEDGASVSEQLTGLGRISRGDGEGESVIDFAWSPDGEYLAYVSTRELTLTEPASVGAIRIWRRSG